MSLIPTRSKCHSQSLISSVKYKTSIMNTRCYRFNRLWLLLRSSNLLLHLLFLASRPSQRFCTATTSPRNNYTRVWRRRIVMPRKRGGWSTSSSCSSDIHRKRNAAKCLYSNIQLIMCRNDHNDIEWRQSIYMSYVFLNCFLHFAVCCSQSTSICFTQMRCMW